MSDAAILSALVPIIILLSLGVISTVLSRAAGLSPIVAYIVLGLALKASGLGLLFKESTISLLAELGVILLLFDIGLHFSIEHVRKKASDIFAFGPFQVIFATAALTVGAMLLGVPWGPALLLGAVLSLSSTAVVGQLIGERRQQGCPVALTATSILVFQDVAAIFLLIIASSLGGGASVWQVAGAALVKALLAFGATVVIARTLIGPMLSLVARSRNEEVFTAVALLIALAAGWATGAIGLSLTLGAFLGGLALAETPYRAVIATEIKPFRGLLLGFFFISIGLSLDFPVLTQAFLAIIALTAGLFALKIAANVAASLMFKWSVPGSTQLGFLLAQGSEFGFVILSLPEVRKFVGSSRASIAISVIALSIALTPNLADAGRSLAGRMRARTKRQQQAELTRQSITAPVIIVGMGSIGRLVADALIAFGIDYAAIEKDEPRLRAAIADGYNAVFGDATDARLWSSISLGERKLSVLTAPDYELLSATVSIIKAYYSQLKRFAFARSEAEADRLRTLGLRPVVDSGSKPGLPLAKAVLAELGVPEADIKGWAIERLDLPEAVSARVEEMA
jgi:CPA2 family monovalent cation:H+ antiporter-2